LWQRSRSSSILNNVHHINHLRTTGTLNKTKM
jgi:hypothetical protein